ncbi:hypothetical protein [Rhizobium sp. 60-20]|uniref:hypothetical protein n=1 Tax=Rhizobium sp. 60-20 TaxID=1895819 RepID=UPI0009291A46|nr:hypothetical protein [Rhizobium sp. 60-20]OJY76373.1 MAG: hypothetical protein BGP09_25695 [Rhizobium sp. 60-20]
MVQVPKYAQLEHERRFLIAVSPDLSDLPFRLIEDLYISATRMRLRAIIHSCGQQVEFKLCKKYPMENLFSGAIVNVYLTEAEYAVLAQLPGKRIRKRRHLSLLPPDFKQEKVRYCLGLGVRSGPIFR